MVGRGGGGALLWRLGKMHSVRESESLSLPAGCLCRSCRLKPRSHDSVIGIFYLGVAVHSIKSRLIIIMGRGVGLGVGEGGGGGFNWI